MKNFRWLASSAGLLSLALFSFADAATCCPFCLQGKGPTLAEDFNEAKLVVVGTFTNAKKEVTGEFEGGTTDFKIAKILKDHDIRKGQMTITLPVYKKPTDAQFLLFCDVFKGTPDAYRGVQLAPGGELVKYLAGAIKLKDSSVPKRLEYCFDFLNSKDFEVALDAYREFAKADYKDYKDVAATFDANKLSAWLADPETPPFRYGLYVSLLGHCGKPAHVAGLKAMLDDPKKRDSSGIDGMFAGYVLLLHKHQRTKDALDFLRDNLGNSKQEFMMRWTALKTLRFLHDYRPDIFSNTELADAVALGMKHKDMADFAIEDLRKWKCWDRTNEVLALFGKSTHKVSVIKRSILRFALQSPTPEAKAFVAEQTKRDPDWVNETRELLELEKGFTKQ
jgi:hypothetical protein